MSATNPILLSSKWKTEPGSVGLASAQITAPAVIKRVATIMIQADKDNTGCVAFGDSTGVTVTTGGGQLQAGQTAVLPIDLRSSDQELYVISDVAAQKYYVSYFSGGELIC